MSKLTLKVTSQLQIQSDLLFPSKKHEPLLKCYMPFNYLQSKSEQDCTCGPSGSPKRVSQI